MLDNSSLPPSEDRGELILLLATLYLRVPLFRKSLEIPRRRIKKLVDEASEKVIVSNISDFDYSQTDIVFSEIRLIEAVQDCLKNKFYQLFIVKDGDANIITSDNPFLLRHPSLRYFGLNTPGVQICVPITKDAFLVAINEKVEEGVFWADDQMIGLTNRELIRSADRYFYSCIEDVLLVDENLSIYSYNINS
jgi:hypothetical protein